MNRDGPLALASLKAEGDVVPRSAVEAARLMRDFDTRVFRPDCWSLPTYELLAVRRIHSTESPGDAQGTAPRRPYPRHFRGASLCRDSHQVPQSIHGVLDEGFTTQAESHYGTS
jgi:hypothetical protein